MSLTEKQKLLVKESFALIANKPLTLGRTFYRRLFEVAPGVEVLFTNRIDVQAMKLVQTLAIAVLYLDAPDVLIPTLQELAKRHVSYGAVPEHYAVVGETLIWALRQELKASFTPEVEEAWVAVLNLLASIMVEAVHKPQVNRIPGL